MMQLKKTQLKMSHVCCYGIIRHGVELDELRDLVQNDKDEAEIRIILRTQIVYRIHTSGLDLNNRHN